MGGFTIPLRFNLAAKYKIEGSTVKIQSNLIEVLKPLSYCFKQTIGFEKQVSILQGL